MTALLGVLILLFGIFIWITFTAILRGWVLSILWGWFVVPLFHLPPLHIAFALGLSLLVGMLCKDTNFNSSDPDWSKEQKFALGVLYPVLAPLMALFVGWCFKLFLPTM